MTNLLQFEKSPYLQLHSEDPVDWYPWRAEAFKKAEMKDKPVFLCIGYSTCHWCHVLAKETFNDKLAAEMLNEWFVPVLIDREERPDIDAVYMAACLAGNGRGGWPLIIVMSPDQKPLWAGGYLPLHGDGRTYGFIEILSAIHKFWQTKRERLLSAGSALIAKLQEEPAFEPSRPTIDTFRQGAWELAGIFDREWGGFGTEKKFPSPATLLFLLRFSLNEKWKPGMQMVERTLEAILRGNLFDHVGGGFFRYTDDRKWLVPHFEKLLYINALLILAYTEAYCYAPQTLYEDAIRRTITYLLTEMKNPTGGFFCGQDADTTDGEGAYYHFTRDEVQEILGKEDGDLFCTWYGENGDPEKSISNCIGESQYGQVTTDRTELLEKLYRYRCTRQSLFRDEKILTAWNGLAIIALTRASNVLEEPSYLEEALLAQQFLQKYMKNEQGRLLARWYSGEAGIPAKLNDYVFYIWALLELYKSVFDASLLEEAVFLTEQLLHLFFDDKKGGFYPYAYDDEQLITRSKELFDGEMPAGNAVALLVLSSLFRLTGEEKWHKAEKQHSAFMAGFANLQPAVCSFTLYSFLEESVSSTELICTSREPLHVASLKKLIRETATSQRLTVLVKTPENAKLLAKVAPLTEHYPIPESGTLFYLCRNRMCSKPLTTLQQVKATLFDMTKE